jgi:hypothetical protein
MIKYVNPISIAIPITGGQAAHGFTKLPPGARALAAFDWFDGRIDLLDPTLTQAAGVFNTTVHEVRLAGQIADHPDLRAAVMAGRVTLRAAAHEASFLAAEALVPTQPAEPVVIDHVEVAPTSAAVPPTMPLAAMVKPAPATAIETASEEGLAAVVAPRLGPFWAVLERVTHLSLF